MKVLILCEGKTGSTALLQSISEALSIENKIMEPKDMTALTLHDDVVVKKLVDRVKKEEIALFGEFDRRIFLVRDPRDSLVSRLLYMPYNKLGFDNNDAVTDFIQLIHNKCKNPHGVEFKTIIQKFNQIVNIDLLPLVEKLNQKTLNLYKKFGSDFRLYKYEQFIRGDRGTVEEYIGAKLPGEVKVDRKFARVERSRGSGDWKNWFTDKDSEFFAEFFSEYLDTFGYEKDAPHQEKEISPSLSADYIVRVINDGRRRRDIPLYEASAVVS